MKRVFLLRLVKLSFVPIRYHNKPAVLNGNDNGILAGISAPQYSDDLADLQRDFVTHVYHLLRQFRQDFHAVLGYRYRVFKMST